MSKKVQVIPLAVIDLSMRYARRMEGNKIRHYRVPALQSMVGGPSAQETLTDFIKEQEGQDVEVEFLPSLSSKLGNSALQVEDISDRVLKGLPRVRQALEKNRVKGQLYQYIDYPLLDRVLDYVEDKFKSIRAKFMVKFSDSMNYRVFQVNRRSKHCITPCTYLSYSYFQSNEQEAIDRLREDLKILHKHKLIMGHLAMPCSMNLADTYGSGDLPKVLFCFLFVDQNKLAKVLGKNSVLELEALSLKYLGVNSENHEGGIGHMIDQGKFEIEEVEVGMGFSDKARQAMIKSYEESREEVNAAAARQTERLKKESYEVKSAHLQDENGNRVWNKIEVKIDLKKSNT